MRSEEQALSTKSHLHLSLSLSGETMGRSYCLSVVLFIAVLALFFCQGSGRKLKVPAFNNESLLHQQESQEKGRKMIGVMDYSDPVPNTNPRSGYLITPPSPPPPKGSA